MPKSPWMAPITLSVFSSDESIAPAQVSEQTVTIFGGNLGEATITIIASDELGGSASVVFSVVVTRGGTGGGGAVTRVRTILRAEGGVMAVAMTFVAWDLVIRTSRI